MSCRYFYYCLWASLLFSVSSLAQFDFEDDFSETKLSTAEEAVEQNAVSEEDRADRNIDYRSVIKKAKLGNVPKYVRHPYLGKLGYRPSLIALSYQGRSPGAGLFWDYSFNRVGFGLSTSAWPKKANDRIDKDFIQYVTNLYGKYHWIPFNVSPYLLAGVGVGVNTAQAFGGLAGAGIEIRLTDAIVVLIEYVYHQTIERAVSGGSIGWTF